jgi:hypothetical protein
MLAVAAALAAPSLGAASDEPAAIQHPSRQAARPHPGSTLDERVALLTHELKLAAGQQAALRRILEEHRAQVVRAWNDPSLPAASRVGATQAIGDRTAERIRALLDDNQKRTYGSPRQAREAVAGARPSVEDWMSKANLN